MLFDNYIDFKIPLQQICNENELLNIKEKLDQSRTIGGGTSMYSALYYSLQSLREYESKVNSTWIVCLTDGVSDDKQLSELHRLLSQSSPTLHLIVIGVNLNHRYSQHMENLCSKFEANDIKGVFIPSQAEVESLNHAFDEVASRLPVSETFELDGKLSDSECRKLMKKHFPECANSMMTAKFWIEFLYRRVKVFDQNHSFNFNESYDHLGSSLMKIMLDEAEQLLSRRHKKRWKESNHEQLIYDFTEPDSPQFRLICTAPDLMTESAKQRYEALDLPGFFIPNSCQLKDRKILDRYLSQALGIPLVEKNGTHSLSCIDENKFVLTLDFTMKLLNIHERIACQIPCIIEGETGVSKTALTKMYSILRNSSLKGEAMQLTEKQLHSIEKKLNEKGLLQCFDRNSSPLNNILNSIKEALAGTMSCATQIDQELYTLLIEALQERNAIFQKMPSQYQSNDVGGDSEKVTDMLKWFAASHLEKTFFEINIDSSLSEKYFLSEFEVIRKAAQKVEASGGIVVVFLDGEY